MKHRRNSLLRALGASMLATLAFTVIAASSAQASGTGLFLINLSEISSFPREISGHGGTTSLLAWGLDIECSLVTFSGSMTSATHGKGSAAFKGCKPPGGSEVCLVVDSEIATVTLLAELLLLGTVIRFRPLTGGAAFAHVNFLSHEEACVFVTGHEQALSLTGEVCAEVVEGNKFKFLLKTDLNYKHCSGSGMQCAGIAAEIHGSPISVTETSTGHKVNTH